MVRTAHTWVFEYTASIVWLVSSVCRGGCGAGEEGGIVVDACCLLSMQSFRKVPKVTKIKDGRVARADLKQKRARQPALGVSERERNILRASAPLAAIDLCHLSGRFKVSIPDLADFELHFSQIAHGEGCTQEGGECGVGELLHPVLLSAHIAGT